MSTHHTAPGSALAALCACLTLPTATSAADPPAAQRGPGPFAVATFNCLGVYWSPPGGAAGREVRMRYRPAADPAAAWNDALPMRFNPIDGTDLDLTDYRGSIVGLAPGTTYEVELELADTDAKARLTARTWADSFPEGETERVGDRDTPLIVKESGTPQAYRVHDGRGAVIDVKHRHNACITVQASHVILRGFTLKGAGVDDDQVRGTIGAITIEKGHDVVIEDCDVSDWGRLDPKTGFGKDYDAAIYSRGADVERLVVQRCRLHHPTRDGSNWYEPKYPTHSMGPQCITLVNTAGNHVIRFNEFFSDLEHMYNDIVGGGSNASYKGSPGPDSDIHGNLVTHCWDDGLEAEGGSRNVRVWDNYISQCLNMIGNAPATIGPLYVWRNVAALAQSRPDDGGANFLKMGYANGEQWMTGHMYILHNTLFRADGWLPTGGLGGSRIVKHTVSRNNVLHVRNPRDWSASANKSNIDNDFDFDLFNGRIPTDQESHGVRGEPVYAEGSGFDPKSMTGRFALDPKSPGAGAATPLPNFSPAGVREPDVGAHQRGEPPMRFGVVAGKR